jgi:hypothetical protein
LNKGIPTDKRFVDEYMNYLAKTKELLIQWLEDFRAKFEQYDLARPTIDEVDSALKLYEEKFEQGEIAILSKTCNSHTIQLSANSTCNSKGKRRKESRWFCIRIWIGMAFVQIYKRCKQFIFY